MKKFLADLWFGEPTLVLMMIEAALIFGVTLAAGLSVEQALALYAIVRVPLAYYNRSRVSPA